MERNKISGLKPNCCFDNTVYLTKCSRDEILWWMNNLKSKNGKGIRPLKATEHCVTDASLEGWGAIDLNLNNVSQGRWLSAEKIKSINVLELLAIFLALKALYKNSSHVHINFQSDNTSAIAYINDMGGMSSISMDILAKTIWLWCIDRDIHISATYVSSIDNSADFFSRNFSDSTEWMLKNYIFLRLCRQFFIPEVDLLLLD